jgi:anti-sigma factor RsiW
MTCTEVRRDLLVDYLAGDLSPDTVGAIERHLESCPACRTHVDLYRRVTCREFIQEYLDDYLDGVLSPDVAADLDRHLEICPPCVAHLNTYRKTRGLVARAAGDEMPGPMMAALRRFLLDRLGRAGP